MVSVLALGVSLGLVLAGVLVLLLAAVPLEEFAAELELNKNIILITVEHVYEFQ